MIDIDNFLLELDRLSKMKMEVGFIDGEEKIYENDKKQIDTTTVAIRMEFGYINENGKLVPPRPFMQFAFNANKEKWEKSLEEYVKVSAGTFSTTAFTNYIGNLIVNDIKRSMDGQFGEFIPLKPFTILLKTKKGSQYPDKPLFDTLKMHDAITFKVENAG